MPIPWRWPDSYNGAIRLLDLNCRGVSTLGGLTCADAVCRPLMEPAGVWADGPDRLIVADCSNHRLVDIDLKKKRETTLAG